MALPINHNQPRIMHVDLNSCFATIEQQANPLLRGKPIVVAAYNSPNGCVVVPSIEAKRFGIKTGMTVRDARLLYPPVIVRTPDPAKYWAVHLQFRKIFKDYSPAVAPKSIDEAVIDFSDTYALGKQSNDPRELSKLLMKLCEKTGRRLRKAGFSAQGVHLSCIYTDFSFWHTGRKVEQPLYTTREIYLRPYGFSISLTIQSGSAT